MNSSATLQSYLCPLTEAQSARVLRQAADHQATILLDPQDWTETSEIVGRITELSGQTLSAAVIDPVTLADREALKDKTCQARLLLSEQTYQFDTRITAVCLNGEVIFLNFDQPVQIQAESRRRLPRIRFAESSKVHMVWRDAEEMREGTGTLGNVSAEGLAVVVGGRTAEELACSDTVFVEFTLPRCPEAFRLPAYMKGITPGANSGNAVLSLKFQDIRSTEVQVQLDVLKAYLNQHLGQSIDKEDEK